MATTMELAAVQAAASSTRRYYLVAAISLLLITLWGFSATYFAPLFGKETVFGGRVADLPLSFHSESNFQ